MHNEAASIIASSSNPHSKKLLWVHTDLSKLHTYRQYFGTRKKQKAYFEKFDECICVSNAVRQSLLALLGLTNPVSVIHNPVDRERILTLSQAPCPLPPTPLPTVCAVGRLSWEKNYPMLLRVHAGLLRKSIPHRLCIVGGGPEDHNLKALAAELGVTDSVIFTGHQDNPYPFIKSAAVTVCSSHYEGLHIASQESLVLGIPVVSSCAVVQEVFGRRECGIITEHDQKSLENGLQKMLTDPVFLRHCTDEAKIRGSEIGISGAVHQLELRLKGSN